MSQSPLAIDGGTPVRTQTLPYGRQSIDEQDIQTVVTALKSDFLTTGPMVGEFEKALALASGAKEAVALANGTAALHTLIACLDIGPGDEVIVPALTFAATANAVAFCGGTPVFAEVRPETLLLDPDDVAKKITKKTRAIMPVDFAGQPADYDRLIPMARDAGVILLTDGCHALGGMFGEKPIGSVTHATAFSMHPVKTITCGEGGAVATDDEKLAHRMRRFRHHGISKDHAERSLSGSWDYDMIELGYNYRLTDFQCALGLSQLGKLEGFTKKRQALAARYEIGRAHV